MTLDVWTGYQAMWSALSSGDILGAVISPFTGLLGVYFYILMTGTAIGLIYMKWNDFTSAMLVGFIMLCVEIPYLAAMEGVTTAVPLIYAALVLVITTILYKLFYKGG